ncbi:hypothetical protein K488DRAFT_10145, partial [Vararia minispora EC-137]
RSKDPPTPSPYSQEKLPSLGPLPSWPPTRSSETPSTAPSVLKPLPEISQRPLPPIDSPEPLARSLSLDGISFASTMPPRGPLSDVIEESPTDAVLVTRTSSPKPAQDSAGRSSRKTKDGSASNSNGTDVQKRVAFISPPPTPSGLQTMRSLPDDATKSTTSRPSQSKEARGSMSTAASSSRTDIGSSRTVKATSTRTATSPHPGKNYGDVASIQQSLRSGTPYSQRSTSTSVMAPASWSEGAEGDLVSNLGARERTRQEVLWEIVASEERYVAELVKMRDTFIIPLLHPYATSPIASPTLGDYDDFPRYDSPMESLEHLPIASRFLSPVSFRSETPNTFTSRKEEKDAPNIDTDSMISEEEENDQIGRSYSDSRKNPSAASKHNHPRSPYGTSARANGKNPTVPFPSRSHHSLPPPPRTNPAASTHSLGRQSFIGASEKERSKLAPAPTPTPSGRGLLRKSKKSLTNSGIIPNGGVAPHQLPDDLRQCLESIENSILEGHLKLSDGLRKRYEEQYPLVRSLADVFVANSHILRGYADYVLHLERALDQVQEALTTTSSKSSKKQDADEWLKVCNTLRRLEADAQEKAETGLAISLSKPFQRLLKYPLLFQNLLFHTDPSTFEYESTLQMVAEVETIVRSIEDDKIQKEERDKTRDVLARIDGLDRDRQLAAPKPSRVLIEEKLVEPVKLDLNKASPPPTSGNKAVKGKTSFKRLSDVLQPGAKKDVWLVVFNDVTLRCQRTGTTSLPLGSAHTNRANSMPEQGGKSKYASTGRRNSHTRPRNMYKFIKVESWNIGDVARPREGVVSMDEVTESHHATVRLSSQPRIIPMPEDDEDGGADSDDSDRKSKMSFSYWGADKITLQKPLMKPKAPGAGAARRPGQASVTGYSRESSANAKFGSRLVAVESAHAGRRAHTPATAAARSRSRVGMQSDDGHSAAVKVTVTRPDWNGSTRATSTPTPTATKRARNTSQNSAAKPKLVSSPAPSEDSGVGLYRQIMSKDSPLN